LCVCFLGSGIDHIYLIVDSVILSVSDMLSVNIYIYIYIYIYIILINSSIIKKCMDVL